MFCQMFDKDSEESTVEGISDPEGGKIRYSPLLCNCFPGNTYIWIKCFSDHDQKPGRKGLIYIVFCMYTLNNNAILTLFHWQYEQAVDMDSSQCIFLILWCSLNP